jgi:predicted ATPase
VRATIPTLKAGYTAGMETGDFLSAGFSILDYFYANFFSGVELDTWEPEIAGYSAALAQAKQYTPLDLFGYEAADGTELEGSS